MNEAAPQPMDRPRKEASNRSFGLLFAGVFAVVSIWPLWNPPAPRLWALALALALLGVSLIVPRLLSRPKQLWLRLGELLQRVTSPIILGVLFYGVIAPISLATRAFGRNHLRLNFDREAATYWSDYQGRGADPPSLKNQF